VSALLSESLPIRLACFDIEKTDLVSLFEDAELTVDELVVPLPLFNRERCRYCGVCARYCPEQALHFNRYRPSLTLIAGRCNACGKCNTECEHRGIQLKARTGGYILQGHVQGQAFVAGRLATPSSWMPLTKMMFRNLRAEVPTVLDLGPGLTGIHDYVLKRTDVAVVVVVHDDEWEGKLEGMLAAVATTGVNVAVLINHNKENTGEGFAEQVGGYCSEKGVPLIGTIPFEKELESLYRFADVQQYAPSLGIFAPLWNRILNMDFTEKEYHTESKITP